MVGCHVNFRESNGSGRPRKMGKPNFRSRTRTWALMLGAEDKEVRKEIQRRNGAREKSTDRNYIWGRGAH
jgi:hypothetical protein